MILWYFFGHKVHEADTKSHKRLIINTL